MTATTRVGFLSALFVLVCHSAGRAWETRIAPVVPPAISVARDVALGNDGTIIAAGGIVFDALYAPPGATHPDFGFLVVGLSSTTGEELWRFDAGPGIAFAVAVDVAGDVIAAGRTTMSAVLPQLTLVKLAGATGAELWRRNRVDAEAGDVAVDAAGDIVTRIVSGTDVAVLAWLEQAPEASSSPVVLRLPALAAPPLPPPQLPPMLLAACSSLG